MNGSTFIMELDCDLGEPGYNWYMDYHNKILLKVREQVGNAQMKIYKHTRIPSTPCQGSIFKLTIFYYTSVSIPQPPRGQPPLQQNTDTACCVLL